MSKREKRLAMPEVFKHAEAASYKIMSAEDLVHYLRAFRDREIDAALATMTEEERNEVRRWADALSTTNCGAGEFYTGRRALIRMEEVPAATPTPESEE